MFRGFEEQLRSGEEREVFGDLCLIQSEHACAIIKLDLDSIESLRIDTPGLLANHPRLKPVALCIGHRKPEHVLEVVFDRVPTGSPRRKRQIELRLVDVLYIGGDVKELRIDACDFDCVVDAKLVALLAEC